MHSTPAFTDSHVHLDRYSHDEVTVLLKRAHQAGVARLLTVGTDLPSSSRALQLAQQHAGVSAAIGLHPASLALASLERDLLQLAELAQRHRAEIIAIGESGLDTLEAAAPLEAQERAFRFQLRLARELALPFILHQQGAEQLCQQIIRDEQKKMEALEADGVRAPPIIVHYFVGDTESTQRWLALGCCISVGKPITRPEHAALRQAIAGISLEHLLLETDTYPLPGRATEPAHIRQIAEAVAALKQVSVETIAEQTTANYRRLFCIKPGRDRGEPA
ncbi:MAG TPA: TatD family hydrolase [Ktedonobacterales bacterium]